MLAATLSQLESHLWKVAWLLKGAVDAADFKAALVLRIFKVSGREVGNACRIAQKLKTQRWKILFINAVNEVTLERAQSFLTDEHLQCVVRAYQDFKDEPGFTRVVPSEEIRAKEGNLSIPLYVGGETQMQTDAANGTAATGLTDALAARLDSSNQVRASLSNLLSTTP